VAAVSNAPSPGIAMLLGFIPGVGAMYNGQFMKGFVHVVIFVLLIIASSNVSGWFGPLIAFWIFYMAFDAYKTAQAKMLGLPLPDPLGLDKLFGIQESSAPAVPFAAPATSASAPATNVAAATSPAPVADQPVADPQQTPVGAIVLIALGVLFLLGNIGIFNLHRMWPLFLIGLGLWIAYKHMSQTQGMQGGR
jgi:cell wall-active antibiotic response 4TMS protein YvqF